MGGGGCVRARAYCLIENAQFILGERVLGLSQTKAGAVRQYGMNRFKEGAWVELL